MSLPGDLDLRWFAKKHVHRLNNSSTVWDAIELMNDLNIRHIPIVKGLTLKGIIDPVSLMKIVESYTDPSTFNQTLDDINILSQNYITISSDTSVLDIAKLLANNFGLIALLIDNGLINGIFTELDLLRSDFLWTEIKDMPITLDAPLGMYIDEFNTIPEDSTIQQALETMLLMKMENIGIVDSSSNILTSSLSFMNVIHYLMYNYKELETKIEYLLEHPVTTIFPSPGLYVKEPIMLSELRKEMVTNDSYFTVLLDEECYPVKIISIHDLIEIYAEYYRYVDEGTLY